MNIYSYVLHICIHTPMYMNKLLYNMKCCEVMVGALESRIHRKNEMMIKRQQSIKCECERKYVDVFTFLCVLTVYVKWLTVCWTHAQRQRGHTFRVRAWGMESRRSFKDRQVEKQMRNKWTSDWHFRGEADGSRFRRHGADKNGNKSGSICIYVCLYFFYMNLYLHTCVRLICELHACRIWRHAESLETFCGDAATNKPQ